MKKIIFCLFSLLLLCGCSAKVNLVVTSNKHLEENVSIWNDWMNFSDSNRSISQVVDSYKQSYGNSLKDDHYSAQYDTSNGLIKANISSHSHTLKNIEDSFGFQQLFKEIKMENTNYGKQYTLIYNDEVLSFFEDTLGIGEDESMFFDTIELNIQFHNTVMEDNSDAYNSTTNTYTWFIQKDNLDKNIEFVITNEKRYDIIIPYFLKKNLAYLILGGIIVVISIFAAMIMYKSKKENEI